MGSTLVWRAPVWRGHKKKVAALRELQGRAGKVTTLADSMEQLGSASLSSRK
ncbi:hypothetical protein DUNSADRAFT_13476 [Dunaliella salina]|uniref:Encoded protein n=1 Tax=Dunaliella salina TaxID=3046 RepID=A0ABQ7FTD6_DUNSA|nr:hypothetical protein DUNSADRAFT_13476 [Dunaliella salina]|eukprot:KAF5825221.1 hypothetical protein DUNSADRAFT_13476 [Dunaliella salina]